LPATPIPVRYLCYRDEFTQRDYDAHSEQFAAVPYAWASYPEHFPNPTLLSSMAREGGTGLVALLPLVLRMAAGQRKSHRPFPFSREELSRLCGCDGKSVDKARRALAARDWATATTQTTPRGKQLLYWRVSEDMLPPDEDDKRLYDYFYFSLRLVYGGHWAVMSPAERLVYLAVGLTSQPVKEDPAEIAALDLLPPGTGRGDIGAARAAGRRPEVRLSTATHAQLARITGLHRGSVERVVARWKSPAVWSGDIGPADWGDYAPVWAYPTRDGGSLLYHLRDHVQPLPWALLNAPDRAERIASGALTHGPYVAGS
jgi:hypothetical protein